ncbi:MAG: phosphoglycerate mutase, partial [candidate division WOR-3 bacterium]
FIHYKDTDEAGEDGDFDRKVAKLEEVDAYIPRLLELKPDVIAITGDHSTPALMKKHSWHPVPFLIYGPFAGPDDCTAFTERQAKHGYYGRIKATDLMSLILANAGRVKKFGA